MHTKSLSRKQRLRINTILILFWISLSVLIIRTGWIQLVDGEELRRKAVEQQTRDRVISSERGMIYDRNNKVLAASMSVEIVSIAPNQIVDDKNEELVAEGLSEILDVDYDTLMKKINNNTAFETVKRKVEKADADKVREFITDKKVRGISIDDDVKRYYPRNNFASHVIGFVGDDNQGLNGLELVFDRNLKGSPGRVISARNAAGLETPYKYERYVDPEDGTNLVLTIDEAIQHFAEKNLEKAVIENKVKNGAAAIVLDVKTGEILAMATKPDYDLNNPFKINDEGILAEFATLSDEELTKRRNEELHKIWRNKAVVDSYEPGSTFKIATTAIALEERVVSMNDSFFCRGSVQVADRTIRCHDVNGHGAQSFAEGVQNSCNPVFIDIGLRIGADMFYKYVKGLGFRDKMGIELPGETPGLFWPQNSYNEIELATTSFGQGFQVTPLQLISVVSAIANDGNLMKPYLAKHLTDTNGNIVKTFEPELIRQIISKDTSRQMRSLLESVVSEGTGRNAYVPGYRIAGKTGTSEKQPRGSGEYIASFIGFAPADDPQIACLVLLDNPRGEFYYGGVIASPVVKNIMDETLKYMSIEPEYTEEELEKIGINVPDLTGMTITAAQSAVTEKGLQISIRGSGSEVVSQLPFGYDSVSANSTIIVYTENGMTPERVIVPNVLNYSVTDANRTLVNSGLNIRVSGLSTNVGRVVCAEQNPAPGTTVDVGTVVTVDFRHLDVE